METDQSAILLESEEDEPQAKKQKQDRSPLVILNNDGGIKKKQLTLKDLVSNSNKSKQINLKTMLTSPKPISTSPKTTPKPAKSSSNSGNSSPSVTRGVKRKSTFSGETETTKTPVKQQATETAVIIEEKSEETGTETPEYETIYSDTDSQDNSQDQDKDLQNTEVTPTKKSGKVLPVKRKVDKCTTDKELDKKPTAKKSVDKKSTAKKGHKSTAKETTKTPSGKEPVKKKFGELKKEVPKTEVEPVKDDSGTPKITQFTKKADTKPKDPVTPKATKKTDTKSDTKSQDLTTPKGTKKNPRIAEAKTKATPKKTTSTLAEESTKENTLPDDGKSIVIQEDGEKPGPSGLSKTPITADKKIKLLTPKQKKLQEEREKKRKEKEEAKEAERKAKEAAREAEKKAREEAKETERKAKEAERKKKEDEKKRKEAEKEAERVKKETEKEEKDAEKKRKMIEREEEKKKDEEEAEQKRLKKLREQEKFKSFFSVKKQSSIPPPASATVTTLEKKFRDFLITPNMFVAPISRAVLASDADILSAQVTWSDNTAHIKRVIAELKSKERPKTDELSLDLEIISISGNDKKVRAKRKILLFHENYRPAYCGSWRKKSAVIKPRRPFEQDKTILDYDYDSDEDWEEEEEGEDITSEKEDEKEEEKEKEEDDEDDGFFVPHGYLSDDEVDEDLELSEEAKKKRVEQRRKQFEEEQRSKQSGILKAKIVGPAWQGEQRDDDAADLLGKSSAIWLCDMDGDEMIDPFAREQPVAQMENNNENNANKKELPLEGYKMLIEFLHGNPMGVSRACEKFQELWHSDESRCKVSKRQLKELIPSLMTKSMRPGNFCKLCWYASDETLSKHGLSELIGLHCEEPPAMAVPSLQTAAQSSQPVNTLRKFTKTITTEEALIEQSKLIAQLKLQQQVIAIQQLQNQQLVQQQQAAQAATQQKPSTPSIASFLKSGGQQAFNNPQQPTKPSIPTLSTFLKPASIGMAPKLTNSDSVPQTTAAAQQPVKRRLLLTAVRGTGTTAVTGTSTAGGTTAVTGTSTAGGTAEVTRNPTVPAGGLTSTDPAPNSVGGPIAPRRVTLVPVNLIPTTANSAPIMIDDDSQEKTPDMNPSLTTKSTSGS